MTKAIKDIYLIQHSHTDIGYTDLQEKIIYNHVDYIREAIDIIRTGYEKDSIDKNFKWVCESYYCVELFLKSAKEEEIDEFFEFVRRGNISVSGMYLNFNDLVDTKILRKKMTEMQGIFTARNLPIKTAMIADINGVSMGSRDAMLENGIEFFVTGIHTHHGMYPLKANQNGYYWENEKGERLLVWNGEKYLLGNDLGMVYNINVDRIDYPNLKEEERKPAHIKRIRTNIDNLVRTYHSNGYEQDFIMATISGRYSDNSPPATYIMETVEAFNKVNDDIKIHLISLEDFYEIVKQRVENLPVYKGDLNDWWAFGINAAPYPVKHYKEAQKMYHLCNRLNEKANADISEELKIAEDNMLLYAEHTMGHSSTVTNPYDTMVLNLDTRCNSYASKAHEASAMALNKIQHKLGDRLRYYDLDGKIKVVNPSNLEGKRVVQFYIEFYVPQTASFEVVIRDEVTKEKMLAQKSGHPRGMLYTFVDTFKARETKIYQFNQQAAEPVLGNSNRADIGTERVADLISPFSTQYDLFHCVENDFFKISYTLRDGITSFYNKVEGVEMLKAGDAKFFTPVYEVTEIRTNSYEERRLCGRNMRGVHAKLDFAKLDDIKVMDHGPVFTTIELVYLLEGTKYCSAVITLYNEIPKIDFKYKIAKTLTDAVESLFIPLTLNLEKELSFNKGGVKMRPGMDQIPGTNNEFYCTDQGVLYGNNILIQSKDVPLIYAGDLQHHAIKLCDNDPADNRRDIYSWPMNNVWETNFKMDLSGFAEYCYSLQITDKIESASDFEEHCMDTVTFIIE